MAKLLGKCEIPVIFERLHQKVAKSALDACQTLLAGYGILSNFRIMFLIAVTHALIAFLLLFKKDVQPQTIVQNHFTLIYYQYITYSESTLSPETITFLEF